jgi:hypothetical protein
MATQMDTAKHEIVLIEEAHIRPMMGLGILELLPSAGPGDALAVEEAQPRTRFMLMAGKPSARRLSTTDRTSTDATSLPTACYQLVELLGNLPRFIDSDLPTKKDKQ